MTADEFVAFLQRIAPTPDEVSAAELDSADKEMIAAMLQVKAKPNSKAQTNEILDLVARYDLTTLEIRDISFREPVRFEGRKVYFGRDQADRLYIDSDSGEILCEDHEDRNFVIYPCSMNAASFLAALAAMAEYESKCTKIDGYIRRKAEKNAVVARISEAAGGSKYEKFARQMIGIAPLQAGLLQFRHAPAAVRLSRPSRSPRRRWPGSLTATKP